MPASSPVLVPDPLRRPVGSAMVAAAVVLTLLAVRFSGTSSAGSIDARIAALVDPRAAAHPWLVQHTMLLGEPLLVAVLAAVLGVVCLVLGRRRLALLSVVGPGLTGLATTVLKPALGRTFDGVLAFPSGHTGGATALALVTALLVISGTRLGRAGSLAVLAVGAVVVGGAVGVAMVGMNAHYPTDTVGGFCTAVVVVCGAALLLDRLAARPAPQDQDQDVV